MRTDRFFGFVTPLPLFLQASSPILLANSRLEDSEFAIPLSLLMLPWMMLYSVVRRRNVTRSAAPFLIFFLAFASWLLMLSVFGGNFTSAIIYALQWSLPFLFVFYFVTLPVDRIAVYLQGFLWGSIFGSTYTALAGLLEMILYGGLLDAGRMSQNLVLPGHYQLYVYVPTIIAFSSLISMAALRSNLIQAHKLVFLWLAVSSMMALVFTAAREGALIFVLGMMFMFFQAKKNVKIYMLGTVVCILPALGLFGEDIFALIGSDSLRLLNKLDDLREAGRGLGGRDEMAAMYLGVIKNNPLFGSGLLPPATAMTSLGVTAPSAHNYYIDIFAWGGVLSFCLAFGFCLYMVFHSLKIVISKSDPRNGFRAFIICLAFFLLMFMVVSNNINVPLRQPLTGIIGALLIGFTLKLGRIKNPSTN